MRGLHIIGSNLCGRPLAETDNMATFCGVRSWSSGLLFFLASCGSLLGTIDAMKKSFAFLFAVLVGGFSRVLLAQGRLSLR